MVEGAFILSLCIAPQLHSWYNISEPKRNIVFFSESRELKKSDYFPEQTSVQDFIEFLERKIEQLPEHELLPLLELGVPGLLRLIRSHADPHFLRDFRLGHMRELPDLLQSFRIHFYIVIHCVH